MRTPKVTEMFPRWRAFPREIESDLNLYHRRDIKDWHTGELSSRLLLNYLDGLMLQEESWYRASVQKFLENLKEEEERLYKQDVRSLIFAQLTGQKVEVASG